MGDAGKKISIAGFALGVIANLLWLLGFVLSNGMTLESSLITFLSGDAYNIFMVIGLLAVAAGYALKFLGERDVFYVLIAVFTLWTFINLAFSCLGYPITLGNLYVQRILYNLYLLLIAVNTIRKGNIIFAALLILAFVFLAIAVPFVNITLFTNFANSLIMIFIAIIGVVELGAFGVAAISELQER